MDLSTSSFLFVETNAEQIPVECPLQHLVHDWKRTRVPNFAMLREYSSRVNLPNWIFLTLIDPGYSGAKRRVKGVGAEMQQPGFPSVQVWYRLALFELRVGIIRNGCIDLDSFNRRAVGLGTFLWKWNTSLNGDSPGRSPSGSHRVTILKTCDSPWNTRCIV